MVMSEAEKAEQRIPFSIRLLRALAGFS